MKLEDFVRKNRAAFDDKEPSEKIWKNIEASVRLQRGGWWNSLAVWRVAAVVFMALAVYAWIPGKTKTPAGKPNTSDIALKEFKDVEAFYVEQISQKVEMIDEFQKSEGLNGFTQDFQQLEAMYMVLKEEMHTHPSQKVKDALVLNLLVRIDLLNQQLHHLEKSYNPKDKGKEETNI
ncbi:MAG TPA: hypothetical protein VIN08_10730 [Ohtaekwangia sp.]|uniref:hypothetical protein n=1 Tax=Ohtaekwangia sp. TaxID=2066019 RepID=UPI002F91E2D1